MIIVKNLTKQYLDSRALDQVSFTLKPGQILGLLGPNGAGKTTLIHILLGLVTPTSGVVSVLGHSPVTERLKIAARLNFSSAYVSLPSNLTVWENLNIFSRIYGIRNAKAKIKEVMDLFEVGSMMKKLTGTLSSGEKTRINLCKAFLNDPELLLLDEPTASLDPEMADLVRTTLKKIQKERNIGILYTSHNMQEVEDLCENILFLNKGKIIAEGTPEWVKQNFKSESLEEVFIKIVRTPNSINN